MTDAYFEKQYKSTSRVANCFDCNMEMISLSNTAESIDCIICGNKLENKQRIVDVYQDPKYTTTSC